MRSRLPAARNGCASTTSTSRADRLAENRRACGQDAGRRTAGWGEVRAVAACDGCGRGAGDGPPLPTTTEQARRSYSLRAWEPSSRARRTSSRVVAAPRARSLSSTRSSRRFRAKSRGSRVSSGASSSSASTTRPPGTNAGGTKGSSPRARRAQATPSSPKRRGSVATGRRARSPRVSSPSSRRRRPSSAPSSSTASGSPATSCAPRPGGTTRTSWRECRATSRARRGPSDTAARVACPLPAPSTRRAASSPGSPPNRCALEEASTNSPWGASGETSGERASACSARASRAASAAGGSTGRVSSS